MEHSCRFGVLDRRDFLTVVSIGVLGSLAACSAAGSAAGSGRQPAAVDATQVPTTTTTTVPPPVLGAIPAPHPGKSSVVSKATGPTSKVALTVDDGYCAECVAGYVDFAVRTGTHLTFLPNGTYGHFWAPHAARLRPLIAAGQVQVANHTWSHPDVTKLGDAAVGNEIQRNETWIEDTFGITGRPYFRPPYGTHNARTDEVAASLGFTKILLWNGTLGDATVEKPEELLELADKWIQAGAIVLGHANHPTVLGLFDQLQQIISSRNLQPATLDAMLGTSRATG